MRNPNIRGLPFGLMLAASLGATEPVPPKWSDDLLPNLADALVPLVPVTYGFNLVWAKPLNDLQAMNPRTGVGFGLFMEENISKATVIQTRLDYRGFQETTNLPLANNFAFVPANVYALAEDSVAVGVDVRHSLPYPWLKACYILGGISAIRYEFRSTSLGTYVDQNGIALPNVVINYKDKTPIRFGLALGVGCNLGSHCALTARYTYVSMNSLTLATIESGLRVSF